MAPAFKEWQVICAALESGGQTVILRKGGIAEGRHGFSWQHERFFLFPTHFHQQLEGVRGAHEPAIPQADNSVVIRLWAETVMTARLTDWDRVARLAEHHIWSEHVVHERFDWGEQPGLSVALLRVRRLAEPWRLKNADRPAFSGCRSWLDLPLAEWDGAKSFAEHVAAAEPVIGDAEFDQRLGDLRALLD